jgi:hypothetical protein
VLFDFDLRSNGAITQLDLQPPVTRVI